MFLFFSFFLVFSLMKLRMLCNNPLLRAMQSVLREKEGLMSVITVKEASVSAWTVVY